MTCCVWLYLFLISFQVNVDKHDKIQVLYSFFKRHAVIFIPDFQLCLCLHLGMGLWIISAFLAIARNALVGMYLFACLFLIPTDGTSQVLIPRNGIFRFAGNSVIIGFHFLLSSLVCYLSADVCYTHPLGCELCQGS